MSKSETKIFCGLRTANIARQYEWDISNQITPSYRAMELAGEVGEPCRIVAASRRAPAPIEAAHIINPSRPRNMGSILVEFCDGFRVVTSRYAVRRIA